MIYIIDRIEGSIAVLEEEDTQNMKRVPLSNLPKGIKEGDCLLYFNDEYRPCPKETARRRGAIEKLMKE